MFILYVILVCLVLYTLCRDIFVPFTILLSIPYNLVNDFLFTKLFKLRGGVCVRAKLVVVVKLLTGATVLLARCTNGQQSRNVALTRTTCDTTGIHLHPVLVAMLSVIFKLIPLVVTRNINTGNDHSLTANMVKNVVMNALTLLFLMPSLFVAFRCVRRQVGHGWVGGVVLFAVSALVLANYNACDQCRQTSVPARGLCQGVPTNVSAAALTSVS